MQDKYIVSNEYLSEKGLDLNDYALDGTMINSIIHVGYYAVLDRMCAIGDQFPSKRKIIEYLEKDDDKRTSEDKIDAFQEVQYLVIHGLIFQNEKDPVDRQIDSILSHQLGCLINGIQKGLFYRNN